VSGDSLFAKKFTRRRSDSKPSNRHILPLLHWLTEAIRHSTILAKDMDQMPHSGTIERNEPNVGKRAIGRLHQI
jgi:hypothetical protein